MIKIEKIPLNIIPSSDRSLLRPFFIGTQLPSNFYEPDSPRTLRLLSRILSLEETEVKTELNIIIKRLYLQNKDYLLSVFEQRYNQLEHLLPSDRNLSKDRKYLIGAFFSSRYLFESVSLCNPSIVKAPEQNENEKLKFILSLRAIGEGHISSISFREGVISNNGEITLYPVSTFATEPNLIPTHTYQKELFKRKLGELGLLDTFSNNVMASLKNEFTMHELRVAIDSVSRSSSSISAFVKEGMITLARSNYEVEFPSQTSISERVIFPLTPNQSNGMEDARFVLFEDEGERKYYATYTAFDGRIALPQLIETEDFRKFKICTLNGPMVYNKGMALFPRKIKGLYAMLSRQSGENIHIMYSEHPHFWYESKVIIKPKEPWELLQIGNCGSPIETPEGWLVLTHGVGTMRRYSIGAVLLDLENPEKVIGRLKTPLITPPTKAKYNYVPDVVYTCGSIIFGEYLIIPYAISDCMTSFARVKINEILDAIKKCS